MHDILCVMLQRIKVLAQRDILLYVVFFTGAVILAVEIMAVRILAPYFGNTIFSFSSVISVILAALSIGYWYGGRLADRLPQAANFYRLVAWAGVSVLLVQAIAVLLLPFLSALFSLIWGPLISATVLFFYPSYLFGLLSPYVIKLRSVQLPERGVGSISGEVFFASTLGSIGGSLLSGFVLIPHVGITLSMVTMGVLVSLVGVLGTLRQQRKKAVFLAALAIVSVVFNLYTHQTSADLSFFQGDVLYVKDGVYERISVIDTSYYGGQPGRVLLLDRSFSSGITLPEGGLLFPYTRYHALYRFFHPDLKNALVLGAGTGTVAREIHAQYPDAQVDMVDIEPVLFDLAHEYFHVPETPHIRGYVGDSRQFLHTNDTKYDFVFGDTYASLAVPWHVMTKEYYMLLRDNMRDGGVYVGNYIATLDTIQPSLFGSILRTISEAFENVYVFAVTSRYSMDPQNIMIVAVKGTDGPRLTREALWKSDDYELRSFAGNFIPIDLAATPKYQLFTDNLAPVELYSARLLSAQ